MSWDMNEYSIKLVQQFQIGFTSDLSLDSCIASVGIARD